VEKEIAAIYYEARVLIRLQGFNVPEVLRKFLPGSPDFIPFSKELPKDTTSAKAKGKADKGAKATVAAAVEQAGEKLKNVTV
jgi:seryl-tRNA synthetase